MRKRLAQPEEELLQGVVWNEMKMSALRGKQPEKLFAHAFVHDQVRVHATRAQQAKVVIRQNGLAAHANAAVFRHKHDAFQ
jgi:DNA-directed RNA polymerase